jgi:hypothetical protein
MKKFLSIITMLFVVAVGSAKAEASSNNKKAASIANKSITESKKVLPAATIASVKLNKVKQVPDIYVYPIESSCGVTYIISSTPLNSQQLLVLSVTFELSCWV